MYNLCKIRSVHFEKCSAAPVHASRQALNLRPQTFPEHASCAKEDGGIESGLSHDSEGSSLLNDLMRMVAMQLIDEALKAGQPCMRYSPPSLKGAAALPR